MIQYKNCLLQDVPRNGHPRHPWWLTLIRGIAAFNVGAILLWAPAKDKVDAWTTLVAFLGIYWLVLGVLDIVRIFQDTTGWGLSILWSAAVVGRSSVAQF